MAGLSMTNKEYRDKEGMSSTQIKRMSKSMAYFKYCEDNPEEDSPALLFGRAYHKWVLEPSDFYSEFAVAPNCDRRTKEGKATWNAFVEESAGKDVIPEDMFEQICDMRDVLYATPFAKKLLFGEHEKSFFWEDDETGIVCKCRPDSYSKIGKQNIVVDLKTTTNAETQAFMRDAIKFGYDIQAAHYTQGMKANTGHDFEFIFVAQEKTAPYCVNILQTDEYFMQSGAETRSELLKQYIECLERDEWPAYMGFNDEAEISSLGVPNWIMNTLGSE